VLSVAVDNRPQVIAVEQAQAERERAGVVAVSGARRRRW